ncbi:MAG: flagellar protein FlaG [Defluviitaleaceae bacterium]|nr:flagellar protein FlaG [Defluviitaleaceae bacterium]
MDVRINGYQAPPPPPGTGGVEVADAQAPSPAVPLPAQAPVMDVQAFVAAETRNVERAESSELLNSAVGAINTSIAIHNRHLSISIHEATGRRMVTVYDSTTNEAIREIPPQRVLDAHANILALAGLFMDARG